MKYYTTSKQLINNVKNFYPQIELYTQEKRLKQKRGTFLGWGRKKSGLKALIISKKTKSELRLLEDGYIRSIGLGVEDSRSFSIVVDDKGIYYDANRNSKLEEIIKEINLNKESELKTITNKAITLIKKYEISKYNNGISCKKGLYGDRENNVLIISQTEGDSSLKYGIKHDITTEEMLKIVLRENPNKKIFIKIHPDVLSGKRKSDINIKKLPKNVSIINENYTPMSILKQMKKVYTKTSGMGFEALLVDCEVVCFGAPFYSNWGLTDDRQVVKRRTGYIKTKEEVFAAAYIEYSKYYNPFKQKESNIIDTIETIGIYKETYRNRKQKKIYLFGFSLWKHKYILPFYKEYNKKNINFINTFTTKPLKKALKKGMDENSEIHIWGKKDFKEVEDYAKENNIKIVRVEDGFIRSISLGSDLTQAYSQVFDRRGIYFDATQESDLENILNTLDFGEGIIKTAKEIQYYIIENKLSKYNIDKNEKINISTKEKIILIPGQVEDDASIKYGGFGMTNLELIKKVREENKKAYIIYKPHPDVLSGNRIGEVSSYDIRGYCDEEIKEVSLPSLLDICDEVHTITSLTGFEALLRNKKVVCYGVPFYSNWGLTEDKIKCERRKRNLSLEELIAGTYVIYPKYINPKTMEYCDVTILLKELKELKTKYEKDEIYRRKIKFQTKINRYLQKISKWTRWF